MIEYSLNKKILLAMSVILVLGSVLRLWGLDIQSFYGDELGSYFMSHQSSISNVIKAMISADPHPPGYHIFFYFLEKLGNSESILRLPSAICGILSIVVIFLLGCRLYSWQEGLIASVLLAFLKCPIAYSQEARPYAMLLLFSLLTVYYWLSIIEHLWKKDKIPTVAWGGYLITAMISCYLHYFGLYFVLLQGIVSAIFFCRSRRSFISAGSIYLAIFLLYIPWISAAFKHLSKTSWIRQPGNMIGSFNDYLKFLFNDSELLVCLFLALFFYLLIRYIYKMRKFQENQDLLLIGWLIVPFTGVYLISEFTPLHVLTNRNLIIALPAAYLLFARAIVLLPLGLPSKMIGVMVLTTVLIYQLLFGIAYYSKPTKEQYREAVNFVVQNDHLYKDSMVIGSVGEPQYLDFYFQRNGSNKRVRYNLIDMKQRADVLQTLGHALPEYLWYIYINYPGDKTHQLDYKFFELLKIKMLILKHKEVFGGGVYLFQNKQLQQVPADP